MIAREVHKARQRKSKDLVALKRILMHNEKDGVGPYSAFSTSQYD